MNVERVVAVAQTVWYDFCLNLLDHRWQSAQSLNQTGIAVNLVIQAADDVVIGPTSSPALVYRAGWRARSTR